MSNTIQITKSNALKAFKSANAEGRKLLKDLIGEEVLSEKITERVKSYPDACIEIGIFPLDISAFIHLPEEDRESSYAHHQITVIAKALNEGWKPDFSDTNEGKYYPYFYWDNDAAGGPGFSYFDVNYVKSFSSVGSRLVFKSSELAKYAGTQFLPIYNHLFKL